MVHAHELPHMLAVGDDGVREGFVTAKGQCAAQIDPIARMRCSRTRDAGKQNESSEKKVSEHGNDLSLYKCVIENPLMRAQHA
jgi:hypothetical protein